MSRSDDLTGIEASAAGRLTLEDLAECCGLPAAEVHELLDYGLIEPSAGAGGVILFDATTVLRVRSVQHLRRTMGVNLYGIALVLEMSERIRALKREVEWLRNQL